MKTRTAKIGRASFIRPADAVAYAVGDLVANHAAAANVVPLEVELSHVASGTGLLTALRLNKSSPSLVNAQFRVHLFRMRPTVAGGDNAAFAANGFASQYLGSVDVTMDVTHSDGASGRALAALRFDCRPGEKTFFALIEARGAYQPVNAEQFRLTAESDPD